ncbi:methyltransferase domain-containing protein [Candidatus Peregrinibacteria bacterium]|nr:methyltransferase domain-containing protein [Candidatus Peregrinibacteria bacterium]
MSFKGGKKSNVYESEEGYDMWATNYDESLGFLNSFEKDVFISFLGDLKGKCVLDLGCGTGRSINDLIYAGASDIYGADISEKMMKIARKRYAEVNFVKASAYNLPFDDGKFDTVTATFLLVHLKNLNGAFAEINRVLKNGGKLILTNINQKKAPKLKMKDGSQMVIKSFYHMPEKVIEALEKAFFEVEKE